MIRDTIRQLANAPIPAIYRAATRLLDMHSCESLIVNIPSTVIKSRNVPRRLLPERDSSDNEEIPRGRFPTWRVPPTRLRLRSI